MSFSFLGIIDKQSDGYLYRCAYWMGKSDIDSPSDGVRLIEQLGRGDLILFVIPFAPFAGNNDFALEVLLLEIHRLANLFL